MWATKGRNDQTDFRHKKLRRRKNLLPTLAVLDHDVDVLQQVDVAQDVAADGDDVGVFAFAHGADLIGDLHGDGGPVGGGADGDHRIDVECVDPGVEFTPGRLTVEVHGDAAVSADQKHDAGFGELMKFCARESDGAAV